MTEKFSRRSFGKTLAAATAGASIAKDSAAQSAVPSNTETGERRRFPTGFQWGCATASYQIEGAVAADGRKPCIWDTFSHTPGKTYHGETGDIADDSYHLYKTDIQLLKNLGVTAYRFSIAWSRIFPDGTGRPNEKGLAHYERVVDELVANRIDPYVTLFHWDLPQALQDSQGGWESRDTSKAFADYAAYVSGRLSDRVHHFFTTNEFTCFTDSGYKTGVFAPGLQLPEARVNQVRHHAILAHGMGAQAIRASARPGTQIGLAENARNFVPVIETPAHIEAAQLATRHLNAPFLTAILEGRYLESYLEMQGAAAPKFTAEDMQIISSPLDFVGLNVYAPEYARADNSHLGFSVVPRPESSPHMASPWLYVGPEALYWAVRNATTLWKPKAVYITENGCSSDDVLTADEHVYDTDRVMYLRNYLTQLHRAASEGYPIRGYFLWSLLDNFEWADGYSKRFGLHYVDYKTLKRTPKLSAEFYRETIARNSIA